MKAIFLVKNTSADKAFEMRETPTPILGAGEVMIQCEGFGLNYADVMARQGLYKGAPPIPCVIGYDVVGKITEVCDDENNHLIGKRVVGLTKFGGYAQFAKTDVTAIAEIDDSLSISEATAIATQYCTAYFASSYITNLHKGDKVLIHASAGGVGTALTQIAKTKGCETFGLTSSSAKFDYLKSNGMDHPINLKETDYHEQFMKLSKGVRADVIFNSMGGDSIQKDLKILSVGGRLINYGAASISGKKPNLFTLLSLLRKTGKLKPLKLLGKSAGVVGVNMLSIADKKPEIIGECLSAVVKLMKENPSIKPISGGEFSVDNIAEAHALLESRKSTGKIGVKW
ncbi:MAG: zinc-binding dehydrogenase [Flavobacteriales bacterium]